MEVRVLRTPPAAPRENGEFAPDFVAPLGIRDDDGGRFSVDHQKP